MPRAQGPRHTDTITEYIAFSFFIFIDIIMMEVRKLSDVIGAPSGEINDFIERGLLFMSGLRNNGLANTLKQLLTMIFW